MLTQIDIDSENPFYLPILGVTPKDSLLVRSVTGLNPPDVNLFIGDYSGDGGYYQGRRVGNRNIVITIDLNPNPALGQTVAGLRALLHKAFMSPFDNVEYVKFVFHDEDDNEFYAVGYTEKIEGDVFSSDRTVQISIICPDPYIRDNIHTSLTNAGGWSTLPFAYVGTADTGFEAEIWISATTSVLTIDLNGKKMEIDQSLHYGDVVYINTLYGARDIRKTDQANITPAIAAMDITSRWKTLQGIDPLTDLSSGVNHTTPLISALTPTSPWLQLHYSAANNMKIYGASPASTPGGMRELSFSPAYWGL